MARRQAGAGKPHSGGKAIVLAGHALRLTRMRPGSMGTCGPTCGCRKCSPVPFHCFRVVLYNEGCNSDVSARAPDRATPCAIPGARALRQAHLRIRGQSGLGATLAAATGWSGLRAWSASHDAELRLCVRSTTAAVLTLARL